MSSQTGQQIIAIHILPNISWIKGNEVWSVNIYHTAQQIFFPKHHTENEEGRRVPDFFLFFKNVLYKVKASGQNLSFNIFLQTLIWT